MNKRGGAENAPPSNQPYQPVVKVPILRIGESGKKPTPTDALQRILSGQLTIWYPRKSVSNRHSGRIPTLTTGC
jgi:hypothetical protein